MLISPPLPSFLNTAYEVMRQPPLSSGCYHCNVIVVPVEVSLTGAGMTEGDKQAYVTISSDDSPSPFMLNAVTLNLYCMPVFNPETILVRV